MVFCRSFSAARIFSRSRESCASLFAAWRLSADCIFSRSNWALTFATRLLSADRIFSRSSASCDFWFVFIPRTSVHSSLFSKSSTTSSISRNAPLVRGCMFRMRSTYSSLLSIFSTRSRRLARVAGLRRRLALRTGNIFGGTAATYALNLLFDPPSILPIFEVLYRIRARYLRNS
jgi:hypothetical protein